MKYARKFVPLKMLEKEIYTRKIPTQKRSKEKFKRILKGAAEVLINEGISALNTNSVAEYSSVTVGSIYQYFPNKEAILFSLYQLWLDDAYKIYANFSAKNASEENASKFYTDLFLAYAEEDDEDAHKLSVELINALNSNDKLKSIDEIHNNKIIDALHFDAMRLEGFEDNPQTRLKSKIVLDLISSLLYTISAAPAKDRQAYIEAVKEIVAHIKFKS